MRQNVKTNKAGQPAEHEANVDPMYCFDQMTFKMEFDVEPLQFQGEKYIYR